jgi:hypothetical protein
MILAKARRRKALQQSPLGLSFPGCGFSMVYRPDWVPFLPFENQMI